MPRLELRFFRKLFGRIIKTPAHVKPLVPNAPTDTLPPALSNLNPLASATGVSFVSTISLRITDDAGVLAASITVEIKIGSNDYGNAYTAGAFVSPYNGGSSAISAFGATGYDMTIHRTSEFPLNTVISVRVSASDNNGNAMGPAVYTYTTGDLPSSYRGHVSVSGQSNANPGSGGSPALSTTQPYDNLELTGHAAPLIPLVETSLESLNSSIGNWLTSIEASRKSIVHGWGVGSMAYSSIKKGTVSYTNGQNAVNAAKNALPAARPEETFRVLGLVWVHGETDEVNNVSKATYKGYLEELQNDFQTDVRALISVTYSIPLFLTQMSAWSNSGIGYKATSPVAMAQYQAAVDNPTRIFLTHPTYHIPYTNAGNDVHFNNIGHRRNGEYVAKAIKKVCLQGGTWEPLRPDTITAADNVITLNLRGGDGSNVVVDTTTCQPKAFYGFEYSDTQADTPGIQSVAVTGPQQIQITLTRNCGSANSGRLAYGYTSVRNSYSGSTAITGPGGNIRDSDPTPSRNAGEDPLRNWLVCFDEPIGTITGGTSPVWTFANDNHVLFPASGNAVITAGYNSETNAATACSWSWWFRRDTSWFSAPSVLWARSGGHRHFDFRFATSRNIQCFIAASSTDVGTYWQSAANVFLIGTRHHCCVVYLGSGTGNAGRFFFYLDGVDITSGGTFNLTMPAALTTCTRDDTSFGCSGGAAASNHARNLRLAHPAVWAGTALTSTQVNELRPSGVPADPRTNSAGAPTHYLHFQGNYDDVGSATGNATCNGRPYGTGITFAGSAL